MFKLAFRRGLRLRSKTQDEAADTPTSEEGEDEEEQTKTENKEEEEKEEGDKEAMDAEDCEVCPGKDFVSPVLTPEPEFNVFFRLSEFYEFI